MMRTGFKTACLAGIAALFSTGAVAADYGIGGACCQDLEERISELEATTARKGNRVVSVTVYGQVNWAILHHDADGDDIEDDTIIANNTSDTSKFGFRGEAQIRPGASAGFLLEIGVGVDDDDNSGLEIRHSALYLKSDQLGAVWLGHTSTATDGIAEISLSNAVNASRLLSLQPFAGVYAGLADDFGFDGGRSQVLKWVSPTIGGFTASAAWIGNEDDAWDVALRYAGEFDGLRFAAGIGYQDYGDGDKTRWSGSASVMHTASGLFASGAIGKIDTGAGDVKGYHIQGGIEQKWFAPGRTTLYGEWGRFDAGEDRKADFWGLGINQSIDAAAMDLYLGYRNYDDIEFEIDDCPPQTAVFGGSTIVGGAIIRF